MHAPEWHRDTRAPTFLDGTVVMASPRECWQGRKALELCPSREEPLERSIFHYFDFLAFINVFPVNLGLPELKNFKSKRDS